MRMVTYGTLMCVGSPSDEDEEEQLMALVEQLQGPMTAQGAELKKYLKDALLPAYNSVRATHGELDQKGSPQ